MLKIVDTRSSAGTKELERLLASRRGVPDFATLKAVLPIVEDVLRRGEPALRKYVEQFDQPTAEENQEKRNISLKGEEGRTGEEKRISLKGEERDRRREGKAAALAGDSPSYPSKKILFDPGSEPDSSVDLSFARAFRLARRRIEAYHRLQLASVSTGFSFTDELGVSFVEKPAPFDAVGVYVPGGRAFYPSSLLMGVVPARIAGVKRIVVATPPGAWTSSPELRWAVRELGIEEVLLAGGAHAIAGLVSISRVAKIVGPGNRFVAAAKHLVSGLVSVDMPAGPSEVLIVASGDADAALVAADLLAQAEHDPDAVCVLFTDSKNLAADVRAEVGRQIGTFEENPSLKVIRAAVRRGGRIFIFGEISRAVSAGAAFAAEHAQVMGRAAERLAPSLLPTSGALFVGPSAPTALGDYVLGPNHVLPTGGAARSFSGLSVRDFLRWGRSVRAPRKAARALASEAAVLARFEGLEAHARSLDRRTP